MLSGIVARNLRVLVLLSTFSVVLIAQTDPGKRIDALFSEWDKTTTPGAAVAVIQNGNLVFEKGYGSANLEYDIPIRKDTVFHVASVSKQFTAMAIVLLEQDKKLSLEDDIHKYLPELPDYGAKITIRNILQHTSGIRDQWQTLALAGWSLEDVITQDQILRLLFRQQKLNFPPGTESMYSNGAFTLAAEIVKRVSGKPFPEFCEERIFRPLGMTSTHFHQDHRRIVRNRAYSYNPAGDGFTASPLNFANAGATSLFTTAVDLTKWLDNFRDPKVGGPAGVARLQEQVVLSSGKKIDYGLGVAISTYRGQRMLSHGGSDAGYRSHVVWFPDQKLGIAIASNVASMNPGGLANQVAAIYLGDKLEPEPNKPDKVTRTFITVEPKALEAFAGTYPLPKIGQTLEALMINGKLHIGGALQPPVEMKATGPSQFYLDRLSADIEFTPKPAGGMAVKITQPGGVVEGERVPLAKAGQKELADYAGSYWSEELETQYRVIVKDGKLRGVHAHHGEFSLSPVTGDEFTAGLWFLSQVKFVRDSNGRVTGMNVGGGRVREVAFVRK